MNQHSIVNQRGLALAHFIAGFSNLPAEVEAKTCALVVDGLGALCAAAQPDFTTGRRMIEFARSFGGTGSCTVVGGGFKTSPIAAALTNGTMGYACDIEPHHPEGILHPIAVMIPTALAVAEYARATGKEFLNAVAIGCEIEFRLSMALGPVELYNLGFHPSAVCGAFGAAAASSYLLKLSPEATERALGLASCQASGMMSWESDPTENARPFQMGIAARNGVTAALLAAADFGAPTGIFDQGHTVFRAFSRAPDPDFLVRDLGQKWDGIAELAVKPYPCVAFMHPALDALYEMVEVENLKAEFVEKMTMYFAKAGAHCIDGNPLKSHCAQYVLSTALVNGKLEVADIFFDRRETDQAIRELSNRISVVTDPELEKLFPDFYATILEVRLKGGRKISRRKDIARGYPESPMSKEELDGKFFGLLRGVMTEERSKSLAKVTTSLATAKSVDQLSSLLVEPMVAA